MARNGNGQPPAEHKPGKRGNPHLYKGMPYSWNPGGRGKLTDQERDWLAEASARMKKDHPDNTDWLIATRNCEDAPWEVRARIAIHLDNKIRSDPPRVIAAAHAHFDTHVDLDVSDGSAQSLADLYGAMIGAQSAEEFARYSQMIDITPSRSLPPPSRADRERERADEIAELRRMHDEERAERTQVRTKRPKQRPQAPSPRARRPRRGD